MDSAAGRIDIGELKRLVSAADAATAWGIKLKRQGRDLFGLSPFKAERTPSFAINPRKNLWFCHATDQGGDAIRLVELLEGVDFLAAAKRLAEKCLGLVPSSAPASSYGERQRNREREAEALAQEEAREEAARIEAARRIWRESRNATGTLVETYLASRGIDLDALGAVYGERVPASLRFHPMLLYPGGGHMPAMVGEIVNRAGEFVGIHRTFLAPDGKGKANVKGAAKLALGRMMGGIGPLFTDPAPEWIVGEGYETTLTAVAALARQGRRVAGVSALSLTNLAGQGDGEGEPHPLQRGTRLPCRYPDMSAPSFRPPAHVKRVILLEDADGSDMLASRARLTRAVAKLRQFGLEVRVATPTVGADFNDMVRA